MDFIHMGNRFIELYKSLSISSKFFTIIDSDEFLYLYDDNRVIKDNYIVQFLDNNIDCNFFAPCWIENIGDNENLLSFNPQNLYMFNYGKPIINTKMISIFESQLSKNQRPELHHTIKLPVQTYGKAPTCFLLLHLKNLNKYQRIKSNMQKLVALNFINKSDDFSSLLKIDLNIIQDIELNTFDNNNVRRYIIETRKFIDDIHENTSITQESNAYGTIEICDDGLLKFSHKSCEEEFNKMMKSDYFDLINFCPNKIDINQHSTISSCM
jgi:hypothetical protein